MSVIEFKMKTHSVEILTEQYSDRLNLCIVHGCKPVIRKVIAGRRKEAHYCANCKHEDCNKIGWTAEEVIGYWNKWNPTPVKEEGKK